MTVIELDKARQRIDRHLKYNIIEFDDYYEYRIIRGYEEKYQNFEVYSLPLLNVFAVVLKTKYRFLLVGMQFFKDKFNIDQIQDWLDKYNILYVPNDNYIINASRVVLGIRFMGNNIVLYTKGSTKAYFLEEEFPEVTETCDFYTRRINTARSKSVRGQGEEKKIIVYLNEKRIDYIPRIDFDRARDYIICNGLLIRADYLDKYNNSIGFYNKENSKEPISVIADSETEVYIEQYTREDGADICIIDYRYVIDTDEL